MVAVRGQGPERRALLEVDVAAVCPRCAAGKGCGAGLGLNRSGQRQIEVRVRPGRALAAGDTVRLSLLPRSLLSAAAIVYGRPLLGAAAGALLAWWLGWGNAAAAAAALAGLGAGVGWARRRLSGCLDEFTPEVIA